MRTSWRLKTIAGALLLPLMVSGAYAAECFTKGAIGAYGAFCDKCVFEDVIVVNRDQPCERGYWGNRSGHIVEFLGNRITQRAKHGIAGTTASVMAYAPAKGYVGPDDFTVGVDYRENNTNGRFFIHFAVTVK